ncbi:MAG TPA: N-acetylmuramoyl-L-alanine amidase [Candidatus Rifleibacterium sp.]|nr:N-acetylmuramoyl-L-alanine amidase [Candidatus Rifleibacterium sp.]HPT47159.1 N-acetylmuramoyl-L-alanine amidase [Candidatus Rifleibacterium sp.]
MKINRHILILVFLLFATSGFAQNLKPLKGISILLDPGHGGGDPGAVGPTGLKESEVNLRVAGYLRDLLRADGAEVSMTRNKDKALTLAERVELAEQQKPDLFVSIHHNASLKPRKTDRSEIYYNAIDHGLSQAVGRNMTDELAEFGFGEESIIVPAGFFVLRNNPSPAVLTEGGYISIPHVEKGLKTGKALTNQAEALRRAIRETFKDGLLKVKLLVSGDPVKIDTPYFNLIFTASKEVSVVHARIVPDNASGFGFDRLPSFGNSYRLFNTRPLASGEYDLQLTFTSPDGSCSARTRVKLQVNLPFANSAVEPVAPFIAEGFKGRFPLKVTLRDDQGKLNAREADISLHYGEGRVVNSRTSSKGETTMFLELDGSEKGQVAVGLVVDDEVIARYDIPIYTPVKRYILGRLLTSGGNAIQNAKVKFGKSGQTVTGPGGYFFCEYPMIYGNIQLDVQPPLGYARTDFWVRTAGEPVCLPEIRLAPLAENLLGKRVAIMAPLSFDNLVRKLVKPLMNAGAEIVRLNLPENIQNPEYQAVLEANLQQNLDLLISFKRELAGTMSIRHYHRGGRGKRIADAVNLGLANERPPVKVIVAAGSDYEIAHTGATAMVLAFPEQLPPDYPEKMVQQLIQVLSSGF